MQMRPAQALTAEEEGAEGSSKVAGLAESWISCLEKKKNDPGLLQPCFAAVEGSALYL